jgi:NAD(P)-dependent dehydrogenase (short-subunit alcohol dehydrogenase family)
MSSLEGRVAIVTGSSQGIGAALALALAAQGAKVAVSDVQDCSDTVRQINDQGGEAIAVPGDVTDNKSLTELVATTETALGPINVLINNAGIFGTLQLKPLMQISEEEWDLVFRVNARGVFQATKAVIPSMKRAGGGSIINIASGTVLRGAPMLLHYVSSKGAVFAMTRSMATELAADNIRVNSIIAGFTASKSVLNHPTMMEKIRPHTLNARMIKRDMTPDDLCGTAVFLASDAPVVFTVERNGSSEPYRSCEFGMSWRKPATPAGLNPMLASS